MKKIDLIIREPAKIGNISKLSVLGMLPYFSCYGRKGCKVTVTVEGPDEVIDDLSKNIIAQFSGLISTNVEEEPKP